MITTQQFLIIINDAPYGSEKAFNALRMAMSLQKQEEVEVVLFLLADAVYCAIPGQKTADGYYNIERMMKSVISHGGKVKCCTSCAEARGLSGITLIEGAELSNMQEFSLLSITSSKILNF